MATFSVHNAKTNLSRLLKKAEAGEEVVIARGSTPVAQLVPVRGVKGKRKPGSMKGKLRVGPEFFEGLPASELEGWH
jgi:prevent-host-death family protein